MKRIVIYTKDIMQITGKGERASRNLLNNIREKLGKTKSDFITVDEFCLHTGLKLEQVQPFIVF